MRFQAGFAARSGVLAGLLAAEGITAPIEALEGKFGLFSLYQAETIDPRRFESSLLQHASRVQEVSLLRLQHAAIEAALNFG